MTKPLLSLNNVVKHFDISGGFLDQIKFSTSGVNIKKTVVHAVNSVSFDILEGETLSVVGESGCGKSTLARTVIRLYKPNSGEIYFRNERIDRLDDKEMLPFRKKMQMVFQDPYASLNPRMKVRSILEEPIYFHNKNISKGEVKDKMEMVMEQVGISPQWADRFPHEFSGGQRQRISIARALVVDPEFIVADEPISALDVSIQAQVLNLMMDLQDKHKLTYLFISHDLSVVEHISNRVAVMYLGSLCELAPAEELFSNPKHPYTQALLSAIPEFGSDPKNRIRLEGEVPTPINIPSGCVFHGRCKYAMPRCMAEIPQAKQIDNTIIACHLMDK